MLLALRILSFDKFEISYPDLRVFVGGGSELLHQTLRPREDSRRMVPRNVLKMRMIGLITPGKTGGSDRCWH